MKEFKLDAKTLMMTSGSSKGTQEKYYKNGYWYKANKMGYEGVAEHLASVVLSHSNIKNYVDYEECTINGRKGCRSKNFLSENESFISFERLYNMYTGRSLSEHVAGLRNVEDRINYVLDFIKDKTGLDCTEYLSQVLSLDALIANTDRHFNNLGIIANADANTFKTAPIFDNGCAFLSNTGEFPFYKDIESNLEKVTGRPFSANLYEQARLIGFSLALDYKGLEEDLRIEPHSRATDVLHKQLVLYKKLIPDLGTQEKSQGIGWPKEMEEPEDPDLGNEPEEEIDEDEWEEDEWDY